MSDTLLSLLADQESIHLVSPNTAFLDLHGLHVKEACSLVSTIIAQRQRQQQRGGRLVVCAGAGKHADRSAADGAGRLASAVERLLVRSGLAFKKNQTGLYEIS